MKTVQLLVAVTLAIGALISSACSGKNDADQTCHCPKHHDHKHIEERLDALEEDLATVNLRIKKLEMAGQTDSEKPNK